MTVAAVLALAYVMNQAGLTITLGVWAAGAGSFFAFLSAMIGWLGVAVTGSDTSSNALFGALQVTAANDAGMSPTLLAAANSSGGVLGKMISPQNLAIGPAAVGLAGQEGDLFRKVLGWSLLLKPLHVRHRVPAVDSCAGLDGREVTNGRLVERLKNIVGSRAGRHPRESNSVHMSPTGSLQYAVTPAAVVLPGTAAEVAAVVRACHEAEPAVGRAGRGLGLSGGALPAQDGDPDRFSRLSGSSSSTSRTCGHWSSPGWSTCGLAGRGAHALLYAGPSSQMACTIGGNVARTPAGRTASSTASRPTT